MALPLVEWEKIVDAMTGPERGNLERELAGILQRAAMAQAYLQYRYGNGCGDQGHTAASKAANKQLTKVRKVVGYSYPSRACVSF
jgi:hypothetical protein